MSRHLVFLLSVAFVSRLLVFCLFRLHMDRMFCTAPLLIVYHTEHVNRTVLYLFRVDIPTTSRLILFEQWITLTENKDAYIMVRRTIFGLLARGPLLLKA